MEQQIIHQSMPVSTTGEHTQFVWNKKKIEYSTTICSWIPKCHEVPPGDGTQDYFKFIEGGRSENAKAMAKWLEENAK